MTDLVLRGRVTARAHVNIALIKYWGKAPQRSPEEANLPAVPSLSLTLDALYTETTARFDPDLAADRVVLDGAELKGGALDRARVVLDRVRKLADVASPFAIDSVNHVPTAAGLASSASGMAALAAATARCAGLTETGQDDATSRLARLGSGSASRSVYGGWVAWDGPEATPVAPVDQMDVALVIAIVDAGPKKIGSRAAMNLTRDTSPFYEGWVRQARETFDMGLQAVRERDLPALIEAMELSTMRMHASGMGAHPPVLYWKPASLSAIEAVERLRGDGVMCGWTMDAGPNVKVLVRGDGIEAVREVLQRVPGISNILVARPGPGVAVTVTAEGR